MFRTPSAMPFFAPQVMAEPLKKRLTTILCDKLNLEAQFNLVVNLYFYLGIIYVWYLLMSQYVLDVLLVDILCEKWEVVPKSPTKKHEFLSTIVYIDVLQNTLGVLHTSKNFFYSPIFRG